MKGHPRDPGRDSAVLDSGDVSPGQSALRRIDLEAARMLAMKIAVIRRILDAVGADDGRRMFPMVANRLPAEATTAEAAGRASS